MPDLSWLTARPIAHRGLHDLNQRRWENTLAAFSAAIDQGYAIECDVHLSADRVPMVFHDEGLDRLTGTGGCIWERTAAELQALRIGGTEEHIPTLEEMLALVDGRVPIVVELKGSRAGGLVEEVVHRLAAYPGPVALMSFEHELIRDLERHAGVIPYGLTAEGRGLEELKQHFHMLAHGISFVSYSIADLPNAFVRHVRNELSMPVITWTVRDEADVRRTFEHADQMTFEGFMPSLKSGMANEQ